MAKLIMMDGIDRTGKDSLAGSIFFNSGFKELIMNRGILSNIAYAIRYNRGDDVVNGYLDVLKKADESLGDQLVTIYMICDFDVIQKRIEVTGHEPVDLAADQKAFHEAIDLVIEHVPMHKIIFADSTEKTPDELYQELKPILGE